MIFIFIIITALTKLNLVEADSCIAGNACAGRITGLSVNKCDAIAWRLNKVRPISEPVQSGRFYKGGVSISSITS